jgi:glycerol transport system substrate-binding protein
MTLVFEGVSKVVNGQTPDYPKLAQLWWQNIGDASSGAKSVQEAMDSLCAEQEKVMSRIEASGVQGDIGPKMAEEHDLAWWNAESVKNGSLAPQMMLENEKEQGQTIAYEDLIKSWQ